MAKRRLTLNELRRILGSFGVHETSGGKHGVKFWKQFPDGKFSYPVPCHGKEVLDCYVRGSRKKFRLTPSDGISDKDFYGRAYQL